MKREYLSCLMLAFVVLNSPKRGLAENWPGWRGDGSGISQEKGLPLQWSEQENVRWKTPIPGAGHSCPIVWEGQVFISTAIARDPKVESFRGGVYIGGDRQRPDDCEYAYRVMCLDAETGGTRWSKDVLVEKPKTRRHTKNTYASATPVTDGEHVFVSFGSAGFYCVDLAGEIIWKRDLGTLEVRSGWGTASSPVLFKDAVIVNCDSDGDSYIAALEKATGEPVWRTERDEGASWGTPYLFRSGERTIVVTNARKRMRGYDAETGKLVWECAGGSMITVPSPVSTRDLVFLSSGHSLSFMSQPILAVRSGASGNITPSRGRTGSQGVAWMHSKAGAYVTSPIAVDGYLYVPLDSGTLTCYEAQTGGAVYENQKLGARNTITASPAYADGRLYIQTEDGECYVLRTGSRFEILGVNKLDEIFCASPAISGGKIFLRGRKHLYCIGK